MKAVLFPRFALELIIQYRQSEIYTPESGGMILGRIRGEYLDIAHVTEPGGHDFQSRFQFIRRDYGHHQVALDAWETSNSEVGYLGEWHTHPEDSPMPSSIDLAGWKKVIRDGHSPYCLFIIVGILSFYFCVGCKNLVGDVFFHEFEE
ncbi:Mov34/MPN/PAD-1 family protein [Chromohalobacter israelensis]|uniref:Mov34/MPN/PAD-1 family protein n=1 Tax=Chromohalobacter israelensis TaxID=141390 RepID=UPI0015C4BA31